MNIAYNPLSESALSQAPSDNDILFDLPGKCIYARGVQFKGTDTIYQVFKKNTSSQGGGYNGLVPAPDYQESNSRYLREDGKWIIPESQYRYQSLNNTDLDTLRTEGRWYYIAGSSNNENGPDKFNEGSELYVGRNADGYRYQKIIRTSGEVWLRIYNSSTWGAWKRWYVDGEVKQTSSTSDTMKPLVLGYTDAKNTSDLANSVINQVHVTTSLYANPKSGTLVANIFKGQLQGTIASNTTATTQQQTDNSTKVATTAFVRVAIANLVNGAPETLDTLKEIADYLQDGSVAGGIVQQLAKKVNKTGDTMSGDLVFQDVAITSDKYPFKSAKLHWSGGSDFASIYYAVTSSNMGKLVFEVGEDGSEEFIWRSSKNGDYVTLNNTMLKSVLNVQAPMFIGKLQGNADTATALTTSAGSAALPVYFSGGKPVACAGSSIFSLLSNDNNQLSITVAGQNRKLQVAYSKASDTATTANKLGSSTIGSATVPIYLNAGSPKACSSTSAATANTIAVRDGSGDLLCRLVRANYADQNTMSGGIVFRINNSGDNYLRCCNNPSAVRSWLGIGSSGDYVTALGTNGNNLTWTKNGTTNNIIIPYATNSGKVANSLVLKFNSGTTEGTNLYTFNGSSGKTIDIRPGSNVQFATTSGTVVISSTNTTYSQATSSTLGLVKIGYGENGKNYPVELNDSGQMYVNVPWTDNNTTYTAGTNLTLNGNKFSVKVGSTNAGNRVVGTAEDGTIYESEALTSELQYLLSDWRGTTGIMTLLGEKQNTITGGATTITSSNLTASRVLVSNSSGKVAVSSITSAKLGYLDGVTSSIQTQLNTIKANCIYRGVCSTSANTAAKTVSVDGNFTLTAGVFVAIRFEQMNAASNPTLNVNNTGAKAIFYRGAAWKTSQDPARQYDTILMTYDGTQWMISALLEPNKVNFSNASSTLRAKNFNLDTSTSSNGTITRTSGIQDLYFDSDILSTTSGLFPHSSNANACITVKTNSGNYYHQIGLSSNKKMYARSFQNVVPNSTTSWYTIPYCEDSQDWTGYQDFQSGAGNSGSDMRFKKEVQNVGNILSKINDLNVIKYIWEHPDESQVKYTFGIDANKLLELGGIFATMVHSRNDKHDTKWVEYDRFGVLAIKAIQELCQTIQQMKNRIEILENKICLNSI